MNVEVAVTVTLNDGTLLMGTSVGDVTPGVEESSRDNVIEAVARTYELMDDAKRNIEKQAEVWQDPHIMWPTKPDDPGPHRPSRRRFQR